jgi:hypothetical protein
MPVLAQTNSDANYLSHFYDQPSFDFIRLKNSRLHIFVTPFPTLICSLRQDFKYRPFSVISPCYYFFATTSYV